MNYFLFCHGDMDIQEWKESVLESCFQVCFLMYKNLLRVKRGGVLFDGFIGIEL